MEIPGDTSIEPDSQCSGSWQGQEPSGPAFNRGRRL